MQLSTRRLDKVRIGGLLMWIALAVMPSLAFAGAAEPWRHLPRASTRPATVSPDMVTACQTHGQATSTDMDTLRARIQAAQAANDPTRMRAILDEVLQQQTAMQQHMTQEHMAMCMAAMASPRHRQ